MNRQGKYKRIIIYFFILAVSFLFFQRPQLAISATQTDLSLPGYLVADIDVKIRSAGDYGVMPSQWIDPALTSASRAYLSVINIGTDTITADIAITDATVIRGVDVTITPDDKIGLLPVEGSTSAKFAIIDVDPASGTFATLLSTVALSGNIEDDCDLIITSDSKIAIVSTKSGSNATILSMVDIDTASGSFGTVLDTITLTGILKPAVDMRLTSTADTHDSLLAPTDDSSSNTDIVTKVPLLPAGSLPKTGFGTKTELTLPGMLIFEIDAELTTDDAYLYTATRDVSATPDVGILSKIDVSLMTKTDLTLPGDLVVGVDLILKSDDAYGYIPTQPSGTGILSIVDLSALTKTDVTLAGDLVKNIDVVLDTTETIALYPTKGVASGELDKIDIDPVSGTFGTVTGTVTLPKDLEWGVDLRLKSDNVYALIATHKGDIGTIGTLSRVTVATMVKSDIDLPGILKQDVDPYIMPAGSTTALMPSQKQSAGVPTDKGQISIIKSIAAGSLLMPNQKISATISGIVSIFAIDPFSLTENRTLPGNIQLGVDVDGSPPAITNSAMNTLRNRVDSEGIATANSPDIDNVWVTGDEGVPSGGGDEPPPQLGTGPCDFGDAHDGAGCQEPNTYPSLLTHNGAQHGVYKFELLGDDEDAESDSKQCNLDKFDDGVSLVKPFDVVRAGATLRFRVRIQTSGAPAGRYDTTCTNKSQFLYLNVWKDWNADGIWTGGHGSAPGSEKIIHWHGVPTGVAAPPVTTCGGDVPVATGNWGVAGKDIYMDFDVVVPANVFADNPRLFDRFRLDYGEDVGQNILPKSLPSLKEMKGPAIYGEVEDYKETPPPTAIGLIGFYAIVESDKGVLLEWQTGTEFMNEGFNIFRSISPVGPFIKINASLIPAKGSIVSGAQYRLLDTDIENGKTYYYRLEDIDTRGMKTAHNIVSATPAIAVAEITEITPVSISDVKRSEEITLHKPLHTNIVSITIDKTESSPVIDREEKELSDYSFKVSKNEGRIVIEWQSEDGDERFNIWRSNEKDGEYEIIGDSSTYEIQGDKESIRYTHIDEDITEGTPYYYKLERTTGEDKNRFIGPIPAILREAMYR